MTKPSPPSDRARVRRLPERADYDPEAIHAILREGLVAHVGIVVDDAPIQRKLGFYEVFPDG